MTLAFGSTALGLALIFLSACGGRVADLGGAGAQVSSEDAVPIAGEGERCNENPYPQARSSNVRCAEGLACAFRHDMVGICSRPSIVFLGDECDPPTVTCAAGMECSAEATDSEGGYATWPRCVLVGGAGAPCGDAVRICAGGLHCDRATNVCSPRAPVGGWCRAGLLDCDYDLYCAAPENGTGLCHAPGANGAPCRSFEQCATKVCREGVCD